MSISEAIRGWFNQPILDALTNIQKEINKMATTQAQYDAILTQLGTVVTDEDSTIATALTAINPLAARPRFDSAGCRCARPAPRHA